jgi:hypothetical protein
MDDDLLSDGETIKLRVRPNAFLYSLEATRVLFVGLPCLAAAMIPLLHITKGAAVGFVTLLAIVLGGGGVLISFVLGVLKALCIEFVITDKRVIARFSLMGKTLSQLSILIRSIERIEVRRYGPRYGSIYLNARPPDVRSLPPASLNVRPGRIAIWLSMPMTTPRCWDFTGSGNLKLSQN